MTIRVLQICLALKPGDSTLFMKLWGLSLGTEFQERCNEYINNGCSTMLARNYAKDLTYVILISTSSDVTRKPLLTSF